MTNKLLHTKTIYIITAILFLFSSCETPISITLPHNENVKVIEGWIENDQYPIVVVSNSMSYYSTIDMDAILSSVDTTAIVRISDDMGNTEQLQRKHSLEHIFGAFGLLQQKPLVYVGEQIKGIPGHTYTLYVESKGEIYTSQTTIPLNTVLIDSFALQTPFNTDTIATLRVYFRDPAESYDCYRYFLKLQGNGVVDIIYSQIFTGTFDDLTFNGLTGSYEMLRSPMSNMGIPGMSQQERENYYRSTFRKGDIIYVKSTLTDKATKEYWFPLQTDISMGMNPFLTPGTYQTNIEGENVTGIWSGYHARYDTVEFK